MATNIDNWVKFFPPTLATSYFNNDVTEVKEKELFTEKYSGILGYHFFIHTVTSVNKPYFVSFDGYTRWNHPILMWLFSKYIMNLHGVIEYKFERISERRTKWTRVGYFYNKNQSIIAKIFSTLYLLIYFIEAYIQIDNYMDTVKTFLESRK